MKLRWPQAGHVARRLRGVYIETNHSERNAVIVAGCARSGTTWVGDVVASLLNARKIFEPFLLGSQGQVILDQAEFDQARQGSSLQINPQLYLAPSDVPSEHHSRIGAVLRGEVKYGWIERQRRPGVFQRRVIKTIRANLFLGYITQHWPRTRMLVVVRNPIEVIESQLAKNEVGWGFDWNLETLVGQADLVRDHLRNCVSTLATADGIVDRLTHRWCIETLVSLRQTASCEQALVVNYGELTRHRSRWNPVLEHFGLSNIGDRRLARLLSRRSITSRNEARTAEATPVEHGARLSHASQQRILALVESYGLPSVLRKQVPGWA